MPGFRAGLGIFLILALAAAFYPELSGIDPTKINIKARLLPPLFIGNNWSWAYPLGTDQIGRDMLVRSLVGLRYSFLIGVASVIVTLIIGCALGTIAGYFGNRTDAIIMRLTDAQLSIPHDHPRHRGSGRVAARPSRRSFWCSASPTGRSMHASCAASS